MPVRKHEGAETVLSGFHFVEGPRWHDGQLWFSDMHGHRVMRSSLDGRAEVVVEIEDDHPSGLGWLADGRLLVDDTPAGLIARSRYHDAVTLVVEQPERVASTLSELPQARKVELREGELTVFPAPGARLFEAVSDAVRDNGWAVSELRLEAGRLDEVFRQVTRGEAA